VKPAAVVGLGGNGAAAGPRAVDADDFRRVLASFPTGVVAITALDGADPVGMTVGTFFSVSLQPLLVGFCVDERSTTWPRIAAVGRFCVNVLADDQAEVARALARPGTRKFAGTRWERSELDSPVLAGTLARIECVPAATHRAGDHLVVIGAVHQLAVLREQQPPLVHFRRAFHSLAPDRSDR
jgi:3-hydroxy-9,10-secoandrosta-1,3,5(10)-triene-9,17-dione monooxygenase reductase component